MGSTVKAVFDTNHIRDLVRRDFERHERQRWDFIRHELKAGMEAERTDFVPLDEVEIIAEAQRRRKSVDVSKV